MSFVEELIDQNVVLKSAQCSQKLSCSDQDTFFILLPDKGFGRLFHLLSLLLTLGINVNLNLVWLHGYSGIGGTPAGGAPAVPMVGPPRRPCMKLYAPMSLS